MNKLLVAVSALAAGALLLPAEAIAQYRGGGVAFRGGGGATGGMPWVSRGGGGFRGAIAGAPRGFEGFRGRAITAQPNFRSIPRSTPGSVIGFRRAAIGGPSGGFPGRGLGIRPDFGPRMAAVARPDFGRYGWRSPGNYGRVYGAYRPYRGYYGGAVTAGLIGGLALGALSSPYYYGYPYRYDYRYYGASATYGYDYPYYGMTATYGDECYWERRRVIDPWGRIVLRRVQVCYY